MAVGGVGAGPLVPVALAATAGGVRAKLPVIGVGGVGPLSRLMLIGGGR